MNRRPRLLFDECLGKPAVDHIMRLAEFEQDDRRPDIRHLLDLVEQQGVWDEKWIPKIADDSWTVITGDRGKKGGRKKGLKLPWICASYSVTHIVLSRRVNSRKVFDKMLTILSVWPELLEIASGERGRRYALEPYNPHPFSRCKGRLIHRPYPPGYIDPQPQPGQLFP